MDFGQGKIVPVNLEHEMKNSYIDYAMSVIVARALPDVRDGLKPVHRRILYAMQEAGMGSNKPYKKSARIVGEVLGKYHPHGDSSVYDAIVRMAQDFSMRYMLADGHGNFGSVDGDPAAAMRYTEVRMSKIAELMLQDIDKETVDFTPNYDESLKEPEVLPAKFPQLLRCHSGRICLQCDLRICGQGKLFRRRFQNLCDLCRQQQRGRSAAEIDRVHAFRLGSVSVMPQVPADCRSIGGQQFRLCRHGIEVAVGTLPAAERHVQVKSGTHQFNTSFRIGFTSGPKNASKSRHSTNAAATAPTM